MDTYDSSNMQQMNEKRVSAYERQRDKRRRKENLKRYTIYLVLCLHFTVFDLYCTRFRD